MTIGAINEALAEPTDVPGGAVMRKTNAPMIIRVIEHPGMTRQESHWHRQRRRDWSLFWFAITCLAGAGYALFELYRLSVTY